MSLKFNFYFNHISWPLAVFHAIQLFVSNIIAESYTSLQLIDVLLQQYNFGFSKHYTKKNVVWEAKHIRKLFMVWEKRTGAYKNVNRPIIEFLKDIYETMQNETADLSMTYSVHLRTPSMSPAGEFHTVFLPHKMTVFWLKGNLNMCS
jgi:hypothetical protein